MTPRAVASDAVKKEWHYARQHGVCVFPVVVPEIKVDFASPVLQRFARSSQCLKGLNNDSSAIVA
jgi:hypothetical protein